MNPVSRSATRGLWPALPLLFLPSIVAAQSGASLEFDSAVDSHRRLNDDSASLPTGAVADDTLERDKPRIDSDPAAAEPTAEPEIGAAEAAPANGAKPAGDRPAPVDPARAMAPEKSEHELDSSVRQTTLQHDSALTDYAPYEDTDGPNWIEANERVGEIGGWREYAKELYEPAPDATGNDEDNR